MEIVEITQKKRFIIIPESPEAEVSDGIESTIVCDPNSTKEDFKIISFKINGKDIAPIFKSERNTDKTRLISEFNVTFSGEKQYEVESTIKKVFSLKYDNTAGFLSRHIMQNLTVQYFVTGVRLSFIPIGTMEQYKKNNESDGYLEMVYNGLLYAQQGYITMMIKK